jgi:protoporphyrinogen oxidase
LLRKYDYGEYGVFDYGMHNFLETGIKELDELVFHLLPKEEWQMLENEKRDLAGLYYNGKLQKNTPYFDIRNLNEEDYTKGLSEFFAYLNSGADTSVSGEMTAKEYGEKRFGKNLAAKTVIPSVEKIHKMPADKLDMMAALFTPMSRVAFADEPLVNELTKSDKLRNLIAWSDQRTLPLDRSSGRKAYYPVKYGAYRVIEALLKVLRENGVTILTDSAITTITSGENKITEVSISTGNNLQKFETPKMLVWSGGIPILGRLLKTDFEGLRFDKPLKTIIVNMLVDKPLEMDDLYYFFCYDQAFHTYRLTNFINYSKGAARNGLYPVCIELLISEEELNKGFDPERTAVEELFRFNVTQHDTQVTFVRAEILEAGFPMPSSGNIKGLKKIRKDIQNKELDNLVLLGVLAEDNLFFQTDVLVDTYEKLINK